MSRFNDVNLTAGKAFAEIVKAQELRQAQLSAQGKQIRQAEKDREEQARKDRALQALGDKDHNVGFIIGTLYAVAADLTGIAERSAKEGRTFLEVDAMTTYPRDLPEKEKHFFFGSKKKREAAKAAQHNAFSRVLTKDFINMPECREFFTACHKQGVGVDLNSEGFLFLQFNVDVSKQPHAYENALMRVAKREWRGKFLKGYFSQPKDKDLKKHMEATAKKALAEGGINTWEDAFKILNEGTEHFIRNGGAKAEVSSQARIRMRSAISI